MPHILNLSNEVLYQIIAATSLHDIESLATSCQTFNILAQPELKRHRELKERYAKLAFRDLDDSDKAIGVHPIYVLRDILHDTALAQYPTTLRIGPFDEYHHDWLSTDDDIVELEGIRTVAAGCDREIQNAVCQCPFIKTSEREIWREQIMEGRGQAIIGLLLTLLPNLTSMTSVPQPGEGLFTQILKRIVEFEQPTDRLASQALTKLARIDARPYYSVFNMTAHEFDCLPQCALLPSMRTISGSHFETYVSGNARAFQWPHDPGFSAVTEINIDRSMVDGESITELVRGVRALGRFSFSFGEHMPTKVVFQPRKMIRGLELYAKCSLSYLHLTGTRIEINTIQNDDLEYDLRVFEKLKQLRIDHTLLSTPCLAPSAGKSDHACDCWPQRLVNVLPASLESLQLIGSVPWKRVRAFFAGFPELKAERLPRLREIKMQGSAAAGLQFVHLCEKAGVILSQDGVEDDVNYRCS